MTSPTDTSLPTAKVSQRWLWAVRIAALACMLLLPPIYWWTGAFVPWVGWLVLLVLLPPFLLVELFYFLTLLLFPTKKPWRGLMLATVAAVGGLLFDLLFFPVYRPELWQFGIHAGRLFVFTNVALGAGAARIYFALTSPPGTTIAPPEMDRRWVWAVRLAGVVSVAVLGGVLAESADSLLFGSPLLVCYLMILAGLGKKPLRGALVTARAAGLGLLLVLAVVAGLALIEWRGAALDWEDAGLLALVLTQAVLAVGANKLLRTLPRGAPEKRHLRWGFAFGTLFSLALLVSLGVAVPSSLHNPKAENEDSARKWLREINWTAVTYYQEFRNGYPPNLVALGPPPQDQQRGCNHANWLQDLGVLSGERDGYRFEYSPGPPVEKPARGCVPGVKSYTVTARPLRYRKTGKRSFFTDETGVIRYTEEDREATAQDSPI